MTAGEFLEEKWSSMPFEYEDIVKSMTDFAKYHVKEALKQASEKAKLSTVQGDNYYGDDSDDWSYKVVNKESILNSYPLENIK